MSMHEFQPVNHTRKLAGPNSFVPTAPTPPVIARASDARLPATTIVDREYTSSPTLIEGGAVACGTFFDYEPDFPECL